MRPRRVPFAIHRFRSSNITQREKKDFSFEIVNFLFLVRFLVFLRSLRFRRYTQSISEARRSSSRKEINKNPYSAYQRGRIDFYRRRIRWIFTRNDSISLSGWDMGQGPLEGNSYFRSITLTFWQTLIASAPCVQRPVTRQASNSICSSALLPSPFRPSLYLSLSHHLCPFDHGERAFSPIPVRAEYSGGVRSMDGLAAR